MRVRFPALVPPAMSAVLIAIGGIVACGNPEAVANPGGTLPPIRTTTTLASSQTTLEVYFLHYRLKAGETLRDVADAYDVPLDVLLEYNKDRLPKNPNNVPIGFEVVIPPHRWIESLPSTTTTAAPT